MVTLGFRFTEEGAENMRTRSFIFFTLQVLQFDDDEMGVHVERVRKKINK
jgi:hypothetical protein